jgi:glycosyltransferase involved in cell wall biosynthesis
MLEGARIAVVVPAYREEKLIARTLRSVPALVDHVVVVDDGSPDGTAAAARAVGDPRVEVVSHVANRGVGAALKTGYALALGSGADAVAVMAGDAQMHPEDLRQLVLPVVRGEVDYAKGDRLSHPTVVREMPIARFAGNHVLSALTRLATGLAVRDSQCGYTVIGRHALAALPLHALWEGYGYPNDLLGWLRLTGARVCDVVVRPLYGDEQSGIRLRHALMVIPLLLLRVWLRRASAALIGAPSWALLRR